MKFSLKEIYKDYFNIGAAVNPPVIETHKDLILQHFNSLTCENEMKFGIIHPKENQYNFEPADKVYSFAKENNMLIRGHNLVWHQEVPSWLFAGADREKVLERLDEHTKVLAERYPDIYCWDVLNEGIDDGKSILRKTSWLETVGEDYFERVFDIAYKHLSDKTLFYNDYNEFNTEKRKKYIKKIKEMQKAGARVNGIGLQCHLGLNCAIDFNEIKRGMEEYAKLGLKIHITELDVSLYPFEDKIKHNAPTFKEYKRQVLVYKEMFKLFREYHKEIETVTFWGAADDVTWLNYFPVKRKNGGLLFDEDHNPKEAFYAICDF